MTPDEKEQSPDLGAARKEIAVRLLTAMAERDRASVSDCLADDVVWWTPQSAADRFGLERPIRGRESVLGLLCGESKYQVGTMEWQHHHVLHDNDIVALHTTLRATTRGGRSYENHYALLYRFDNRGIVEGWEIVDTAYAFARFSN